MSGRIRTIKPELLEDAVTAGLSDMAFRVFVSVIVLADDYGRFRAETGWLLGQIFWARSVRVEDFIAAIAELDRLVMFYEVSGQRYAAIRNWSKHQKVSHPGKPRIPEPPETLPKPSGESRETLVPDLRPGTTDQGPPTRDPEPRGSVEVIRFQVGGVAAHKARQYFEDSVTASTGGAFALATAPFHDRDLCLVMNKHGPKGDLQPTLDWLGETVAAWVKSSEPNGWTPGQLLTWLNSNRPNRRSGTRGRADTRQPLRDPNPDWLKTGSGDDL